MLDTGFQWVDNLIGISAPIGFTSDPRAMQNAHVPRRPRWPRIDPTRQMSDKAARLLCVGGLLKVAP